MLQIVYWHHPLSIPTEARSLGTTLAKSAGQQHSGLVPQKGITIEIWKEEQNQNPCHCFFGTS
jgi:hypothetical protein